MVLSSRTWSISALHPAQRRHVAQGFRELGATG